MRIIVVVMIVGRLGGVRRVLDVTNELLAGDDEIQSTLEPIFMAEPMDQSCVGGDETRAAFSGFVSLRKRVQTILSRLAMQNEIDERVVNTRGAAMLRLGT